VTTAAGLAAVTLAGLAVLRARRSTGRLGAGRIAGSGPRAPGRGLAVLTGVAGAVWAGLTAEFAWRRIAPGPRTPDEVWRMVVTSVVIPPVACAHRLRGEWRVRR
jgi:hypothetical protein